MPNGRLLGHLKCELYHLSRFDTYEELEAVVEVCIHFYKRRRCQEKHKGLNPLEARNQALAA